MPSATILDSVVKITLKGYEAAKKQLVTMAGDVKKLNSSLATIGNASAKGFTLATGGILGFVKAADPVRFMVFTQKLEILCMYIGLTFIPILDDAIKRIDMLINIFANLTDSQREQILEWTKIGLAILAAGAALAGVLGIVSKAIPVIQALGVAIKILMSSTGVGLVIALAAVAYGIYELLKATGKLDPFLERITKLFDKMMVTAIEPLLPVLDKLASQFVGMVDAVLPVLSDLATQFVEMVNEILPILADLASTGGALLAELGKAYGELIKENLPLFKEFAKSIGTLLKMQAENFMKLLPALVAVGAAFAKIYMIYYSTLAKVFMALLEAATAIMPTVIQVTEDLTPVFIELANAAGELAPLIAELIGLLIKMAGGAIVELIKTGAELFNTLWKAFGPGMIDHIKMVVQIAKMCLEVIAKIVDKATELADTVNSLNPVSGSSGGRSRAPGRPDNEEQAVGGKAYLAEKERLKAERMKKHGGDAKKYEADWEGQKADNRAAEAAKARAIAEYRKQQEEKQKQKEPTTVKNSGADADWKKIASVTAGIIGKSVKETKKGDSGNKFAPMAGMGKVEIMGVEEAFKRAQTAAEFNPAKMADIARKQLMVSEKTNTSVRGIEVNTTPTPQAAKVR